MTDQVPDPYKTPSRIMLMYILMWPSLMINCWNVKWN